MPVPPKQLHPSINLRLVSLLAVGLIFACGAWLQAGVHLNHDVAWITHGAVWMLQGKHFGHDIIDVNPPLIWFVSMPAAWLVKHRLCTEADAIRLYVWFLCGLSLLLCHRLLRPLRLAGSGAESAAILLGAAFAMAILPKSAFGQREHLAFVLGLPYCLLIAARLGGAIPARGIAPACGVLAGIAFGFKPWFLAVPLLLEILHLARARTLRSVWRAETLSLTAVLLIYLLAIVLFAREYLTVVLPMSLATYWAYDGALDPWYHWGAALLPFGFALLFLAVARRFPPAALALTAAFAGFSFSHWAQHKGFAYHAYPALAVAVTLSAYATALAARALLQVKWPVSQWVKVAMAACPVVVAMNGVRLWSEPVSDWAAIYDMRSGRIGSFRSEVIDRVNAAVPRGGCVYAFSSHPFPAFPTMSYTVAEWGSPMVGQFVLPALLARDRVGDPARLAALDRAVQAQREQVLADFTRCPPDLVLIETGPERLGMHGRTFDDLAFYNADPRFAALWQRYTEADPLGSLRVFRRLN